MYVCMDVCMYVCVYVCMFVFTYVSIVQVSMYIHMCVYMWYRERHDWHKPQGIKYIDTAVIKSITKRMHVCIYVCIYVCLSVCLSLSVCMQNTRTNIRRHLLYPNLTLDFTPERTHQTTTLTDLKPYTQTLKPYYRGLNNLQYYLNFGGQYYNYSIIGLL